MELERQKLMWSTDKQYCSIIIMKIYQVRIFSELESGHINSMITVFSRDHGIQY